MTELLRYQRFYIKLARMLQKNIRLHGLPGADAQSGEVFLQYGYSVTVNNNDYMFGGVVIGQFTRYIHMALVVGGKLLVVGSKAICLQVDA